MWAPVFIPGRASRAHHSAGSPPRQKHYGISAVALGYPVLNEHQHSQGHQEQPLHLRNAGLRPAFEFNLPASRDTCKLTVACQKLCQKEIGIFFFSSSPCSLAFLTRLWWWAINTSSKMTTRQRLRAQSSMQYWSSVLFIFKLFFCMNSNSSISVLQIRFFWDCDRVRCREEDQSAQRPWGHR